MRGKSAPLLGWKHPEINKDIYNSIVNVNTIQKC